MPCLAVVVTWHSQVRSQEPRESADPGNTTETSTDSNLRLGPDGKPWVLPDNPEDPAALGDEPTLKAVQRVLQGGGVPQKDVGMLGDLLEHLHREGSVLEGSSLAPEPDLREPSHSQPMSRPRLQNRQLRAAESLLQAARWIERLSQPSQTELDAKDSHGHPHPSGESFDAAAPDDHNGRFGDAPPAPHTIPSGILVNELRRRAVWHLQRALERNNPTAKVPPSFPASD
ncbi:MAG: hypothetical protein AAGD07_05470 [Planctomycetota bacterium]